MDTNTVLPASGSSVDRCRVVFDYWLDGAALQQAAAADARGAGGSSASATTTSSSSSSSSSAPSSALVHAALQSRFVRGSLRDSHRVQVEDVSLCEAVQAGLQEPCYGVGRYAPGPEAPMYHYHSLLYRHLLQAL
jgi:hypothetical protein